eukprot:CAMPEP_0119430920 /NCGR_PEP_ID=MMETSP1335-20130426/44957_1 /TAXON_ID=259385 /ORGANISM="Chrysoculter rhomboideus, Strain RCC1486" /LENGTH=85 /DNA_ID=CAMNT_0007456695 /DNA_START=23 /DNA_END=280 /DNA_ORIENTATION=+
MSRRLLRGTSGSRLGSYRALASASLHSARSHGISSNTADGAADMPQRRPAQSEPPLGFFDAGQKVNLKSAPSHRYVEDMSSNCHE